MIKIFCFKLISTFLVATLLSSCSSKKENFEIDLSNFKVQSKNTVKKAPINESESLKTKKEIIKNELKSYQNKSEVLSAVKFGKKDPFSEVDIESSKFDSNFLIKGFLKTNQNNYVFVSYSGNEGSISEGSIGGENTDLLPDGAKIIKIDPINMKLIIEYDNENLTFEL
tara:strand:- start:638 stop:1144 length:507 start_codon:yes stop_codon:yes gene_type:complete